MSAWIRKLAGLFRRNAAPVIEPSRATVPHDTLVIAIGDVHGCIDLLEDLWKQLSSIAARSQCRRKVLVFLGDYVDRGPRSAEVIERLAAGFDGFETVCLKGNHEETLLKFLQDPSVGDIWKDFGGLDTLRSYGISHAPGSNWADTRASFAMVLPPAHLDFLKNLKLQQVEGDYFFVHAGVRPHVRLEEQQEYDLLWIRDEFLGSDASFGRVVVHGHT
ncbi:MAG: metallophosphoesterase family protein, partial [Alphaproteobacteria bacterium]